MFTTNDYCPHELETCHFKRHFKLYNSKEKHMEQHAKNMDKFNDHDFLPNFIDKYREMPCLWQVKNPFFNNKLKRNSLSTLLSTLPSTLPSTSDEASDVQPGPSTQEDVEEPSLSQGFYAKQHEFGKTMVQEFILIAFPSLKQLQLLLFLLVLVAYIICVTGNITIIILVRI
ncbi:hypothetical protein AB205_0218680 [Aquarana catesbeiana]|uniref:MADF domain-containing protein n=1 Tax=Aquarana catesbeiana TaxID=8400 RepID=A0A2G9S4J2_AQUCT|nr:hypothetical protein AB205_0218680 [Aquarana catesbeiana]